MYSFNRVTPFLVNIKRAPIHQRNAILNATPDLSLVITFSVGHVTALNQQKEPYKFIKRDGPSNEEKLKRKGKSHFWV